MRMFESARAIDTLFIVIIKIHINDIKETTIGGDNVSVGDGESWNDKVSP